jgi:protein SCO1/2
MRRDRGIFGLALAAACLGLVACGPSEAAPDAADERAGHPHASHEAHDSAGHRDLAASAPSDYSIYHAASTWTDQEGRRLPLGDLAGKPRVVAMVYTSCAYACPRIMLDMKRIEGELGDRADDVGFVLVSIDPERDTPERLAEFAAGSRLDPDRWTLLTAGEGDLLELAALLGVQYRQTAPGEWVHSNLITILDPDGVVVHRQLGLGTDPSETVSVLRTLIG